MSWFTDLANPTRFLNLTARLLPWLWGLSLLVLVVGFYMAFFEAPEDYQQGQTIRIMFIHVPFAWLAMAAYGLMALSSIGTLVWKHPLADVSAKALAPLGAAFALICLLTGSFWGKPMWGTWWVWDARLTSMLVLFLMYLGLIALWSAVEDPIRAGKAAAVLTLVGSINLPIIKYSVDWWNTLHQPASVFRFDGPTIHVSMLIPLLLTAIGMTILFLALHMFAMRTEILRRRVRTLTLMEASQAGAQ
ncbi:MAG: heme ABC transporter permease [Hyphomicrobiales bacterium]